MALSWLDTESTSTTTVHCQEGRTKMKFHALFALVSFLAFSTLARSQTSVSTTSFNYCVTAYGLRSISPVPTVFATVVTVSTTKTTVCLYWSSCLWNCSWIDDSTQTSTISQCTLTIPQLPISRATKTNGSVTNSTFTGALTHNTNAHSVIIRLPRRLKQPLPLLPRQPPNRMRLRRRRSRLASTR